MANEQNEKVQEEQEVVQEEVQEEAKADQPSEATSEKAEEGADDELEQQIKQLEQEKEELKTRLLRVQADYDNFRRRTKEERVAASKYRSQSLAEKLLPALDNFDRALQLKPEGEEAKSLWQGMEIVHRMLKEGFEQENIKEIEAEGKLFDPEFHQAVMQVEDEEYEPNTVVDVMQKGYMLGDRVIRPAMVKVTG